MNASRIGRLSAAEPYADPRITCRPPACSLSRRPQNCAPSSGQARPQWALSLAGCFCLVLFTQPHRQPSSCSKAMIIGRRGFVSPDQMSTTTRSSRESRKWNRKHAGNGRRPGEGSLHLRGPREGNYKGEAGESETAPRARIQDRRDCDLARSQRTNRETVPCGDRVGLQLTRCRLLRSSATPLLSRGLQCLLREIEGALGEAVLVPFEGRTDRGVPPDPLQRLINSLDATESMEIVPTLPGIPKKQPVERTDTQDIGHQQGDHGCGSLAEYRRRNSQEVHEGRHGAGVYAAESRECILSPQRDCRQTLLEWLCSRPAPGKPPDEG